MIDITIKGIIKDSGKTRYFKSIQANGIKNDIVNMENIELIGFSAFV
tara:strand:+ start:630 stop:770 length:141 start_codon:yes stop_codon:yes gene_type:complete